MGFAAIHTVPHPPWDSNTDEVTVSLIADATGNFTVPVQCEYVILSTNNAHTAAVFVSPDAVDIDSGLLFNDTGGDVRLGFPVTPGTVISLHNSSGATTIIVNVVRFYNTAT